MSKFTRTRLAVALSGLASLTAFAPAQSHHSFAMYDIKQVKVFTGVVVRVNPDSNHMHIFFAPLNEERTAVIRDAENKPVVWSVELGGAAQEAQKNISQNTFPPGTIFSVGLFPLRSGLPAGNRGNMGLVQCPPKTPPKAGLNCDSIEGSVLYGEGALPKQSGPTPPGVRP